MFRLNGLSSPRPTVSRSHLGDEAIRGKASEIDLESERLLPGLHRLAVVRPRLARVVEQTEDHDAVLVPALGPLDQLRPPEGVVRREEDRMETMMQHFDHTMRASVCMADYADFFAEAAEYVLDICDIYVPQ